MPNGKYIVIEGIEAAGKSAVVQLLARELQTANIPVQVIEAPERSPDITAQALQRIIDDPRYPVNDRAGALLHNTIRAQALEEVRRAVAGGAVCLATHGYLGSLVAQYYGRGDIADYPAAAQIVQFAAGQIQPDLIILLDAPVDAVKKRIEDGGQQARLDEAYLERLRAGYLWEAKQRNLPTVYVTGPAEASFGAVWEHVRKAIDLPGGARPEQGSKVQSVAEVLAANPPAKSVPVEPPVVETATLSGENKPDTDATSGQSTAPSPEAPRDKTAPEKPAAQKHSGSPAAQTSTPVQLFAGQYIVAEDPSDLLVGTLRQNQRVDVTEQLVRHARPDRKDTNGHYRYYIPPGLKGKLRSQYIRTTNEIFDTYSKLITDLAAYYRAASPAPAKDNSTDRHTAAEAQAADTLRVLLPAAAMTTAGIYASGEALQDLAAELLSNTLPDARTLSRQLSDETRKPGPALPETADEQDRSNLAAYQTAVRAHVQKLARELLPANHTAEYRAVTLAGYAPRSELDIVADILYEHADLPLQQLRLEVAGWPYQRKVDVLSAFVGERATRRQLPGRPLDAVSYSFDVVSAYTVFRDLQRLGFATSIQWQPLSPRLGYDVPDAVEKAGLGDAFEQCFDLSLQLYSALQAGGFPVEAQYAVLSGHKIRGKIIYSARQAFRLFEEPRAGQYDRTALWALVQQMYENIAGVHPLLAGTMRFARLP